MKMIILLCVFTSKVCFANSSSFTLLGRVIKNENFTIGFKTNNAPKRSSNFSIASFSTKNTPNNGLVLKIKSKNRGLFITKTGKEIPYTLSFSGFLPIFPSDPNATLAILKGNEDQLSGDILLNYKQGEIDVERIENYLDEIILIVEGN